MRPLTILLVLVMALAALGCSAGSRSSAPPVAGERSAGVADVPSQAPQAAQTARGEEAGSAFQNVSLSQADAAQQVPVPAERKIIRNASLTIEADRPAEAMRKVASLAEARGGFVVTSETRQQTASDGSTSYEVVTIDVRVPAAQFDAVVGEIRAVGGRVVGEKVTGQDVTEEYIDLEARIRTQRALEAQFLEIMKGARAVSDALQVQRELATVRGDIERLEGRRRFLENQTSLSTIKVTLQPPAPLINAAGFSHGLRDALGDGVDAAVAITLVLVRVLLALVPVALFILLPLFLLTRFLVRRLRRRTPLAALFRASADLRLQTSVFRLRRMLRMRFLWLALVLLFFNACATSTPPAENVSPAASTPAAQSAPSPSPTPQILIATAEETRLAAGGAGEAVVRLNIAAGWHVHANPPTDKFYIGTEVQAEPQGGVAPGRPVYPPGEKKQFEFSPQPLASYEGSVAVRLPLRAEASVPKGAHTFRARVRYQPCNDRECLPPRTVEVDIPVTVS